VVRTVITSELQDVAIVTPENSQNLSLGNIFTVCRTTSNLKGKMFVEVLPLDSKLNHLKRE